MGWLTNRCRPRHIAKRIHLTACETPNKSRNIANGTTFALNFTVGVTQRYIHPTGETPCDHSQSKNFWPCLVVAPAAAAATKTMAGAMAMTTLPAVHSRTTALRTTSEKAPRTRPGGRWQHPTQMSVKAFRKCPEQGPAPHKATVSRWLFLCPALPGARCHRGTQRGRAAGGPKATTRLPRGASPGFKRLHFVQSMSNCLQNARDTVQTRPAGIHTR